MDERDSISPETGNALLALARAAVASALRAQAPPRPQTAHAILDEPRGAFVTLKKRGMLRGCIGRVDAEWPLWETVVRMARAAAFDDPRFPALEAAELDEVEFEISVMSPLHEVASGLEVEPGRHGVMLSLRGHRALFLPQVATEQGWNREEFALHTCRKAGLPPEALEDPETRMEIFTASIFSEEDFQP